MADWSATDNRPAARDWLVVMALPMEAQDVFEKSGIAVLYTGIGKVNAAMTLARELARYQLAGKPLPPVVNFGSAGSPRFPTGAVVACTRFIQRDMDVSGLGFAHGTTPYEDEIPQVIEFPAVFSELPSANCGTGDSFVTGAQTLPCDVMDMEAYALAKVCHVQGTTFACAKFISDGADHSAASDWQANLHRAAEQFLRLYQDLVTGHHAGRPA